MYSILKPNLAKRGARMVLIWLCDLKLVQPSISKADSLIVNLD